MAVLTDDDVIGGGCCHVGVLLRTLCLLLKSAVVVSQLLCSYLPSTPPSAWVAIRDLVSAAERQSSAATVAVVVAVNDAGLMRVLPPTTRALIMIIVAYDCVKTRPVAGLILYS